MCQYVKVDFIWQFVNTRFHINLKFKLQDMEVYFFSRDVDTKSTFTLNISKNEILLQDSAFSHNCRVTDILNINKKTFQRYYRDMSEHWTPPSSEEDLEIFWHTWNIKVDLTFGKVGLHCAIADMTANK